MGELNTMSINFLDPEKCRFYINPNGFTALKTDDKDYRRVRLLRTLPLHRPLSKPATMSTRSASPTPTRVLHPLTTLPRTLWLPRSASSMTLLTLTLPAFTPSSRPKLRARALRSSLLKLSPATTRATCPPRLPSARKLALSWCSCPSTTPRLLRS